MLAVVKKRRTNKQLFEIKGDIPKKVLDYLTLEYGNGLEILDSDKDESVNIFDTPWFKNINKTSTPGESLKIYRQNLKLTQGDLGKKLGGFTKQNISDMENGRRNISKDVAKKLCVLFDVPVERFL